MQVDPELLVFLHYLQVSHPVSRDPNDLTAFVDRYDAISNALPGPAEPLNVITGTFNLNVTACGEKARIEARLYLPEGVAQPVLMAIFMVAAGLRVAWPAMMRCAASSALTCKSLLPACMCRKPAQVFCSLPSKPCRC